MDPQSDDEAWPLEGAVVAKRGTPHWLILLGFWGATATMVLLALVAKPDERGFGTHEQLGLPPCRMMAWTDVPCPGCGVTTSVTLASQGQFVESFLVQPFGLLTAIALPLLALWALFVHRRGADLYEVIARHRAGWVKVTLGLMGAAWVYKLFLTFS
jgi:Protein of unknown function (DUF2752)